VVGQPDAVGGLVEGVAGRAHGRGVHRQDDGRLAVCAHLGRGRRGGGRISTSIEGADVRRLREACTNVMDTFLTTGTMPAGALASGTR
jgi:hypothetical protein